MLELRIGNNIAIYGVDRLTLWLDTPIQREDLSMGLKSKTAVTAKLTHRNPRWKCKIDIFQPSYNDLGNLHETLGGWVQCLPNYVELKIDLLADGEAEAIRMRNRMLSVTKFKHIQNHFSAFKSTLYAGKRSALDRKGFAKKDRHVIAAYCDKACKDLRAKEYPEFTACMHLEHRLFGAHALASHGISSLEDLLNFDHISFHNRMQRMHILPSQTELGELLASVANDPCSSEGPALRKRARTWKAQFMVDGAFCLHNALRDRPELIAKLPKQSFREWLETSLAIH